MKILIVGSGMIPSDHVITMLKALDNQVETITLEQLEEKTKGSETIMIIQPLNSKEMLEICLP